MNEDFLYVQIYKDLSEQINNGKYKVGDKIPTEKEIAYKYNVSRITSQKAMNMLAEKGLINRYSGVGSFVSDREKKQKNEDKLEKISGKKKIIGIVVEELWCDFGIGIFEGAYKTSDELGYDLVMKKSHGNQKDEERVIQELIEMGAIGIIIMPVHGDYYSERILELFLDGYPIVFIDRYLHGIQVPFISSNNVLASMKAVSYFASHGHKNIALITAPDKETTTLDDRKEGYIQGILSSGLLLNKEYIYDGILDRLPGEDSGLIYKHNKKNIKEFLNSNPKITAIIATEYYIAEIIKKTSETINIDIPEDIELICFDSPESIVGRYQFTHIKQNQHEMGSISVKMLNNLIIGERQEEKRILLDVEIIKGMSTKR